MHCGGERLSITSVMEWPQMKGERLLTAPNKRNATITSATATATASSSATARNSSSGASTDTHNKANMVHADSTTTTTSNATPRVMDKPPGKDHHHHHQAALRCPRCDSSNTKFCYYNNYSLSQPRHFCKACKRYWTRGGTLRNVPVGGGCRKNKRTKKPNGAAAPAAHHLAPPSNNPQHPRPRSLLPTDPISSHMSASSSQVNAAALYALQMAAASSSSSSPSSDMNLTLPIILNSLSNSPSAAASDLLPHLGALGLGLSSNHQRETAEFLLGGLQPLPPLSSTVTSTFLSDYPLSGSSLLPSAALLASSIKHPKQVENYDHVLLPFDEMQACGMSGAISGMMKEVKLEGQNTNTVDHYSNLSSSIDWQIPSDTPLDNLGPATAMYWANAAAGGWLEYGTNYGSSVAPLI